MKNILIFNDISGLGNCSMSANLPIFSVTGNYCMPVPTACFSKQTGFDGFHVQNNADVDRFYADIAECRRADAVYVGFCNRTQTLVQVKSILRGIGDAFVVVDPIMGDNGKLYPVFDLSYVAEMKNVVKLADCITPNVTEACLLADVDYASLTRYGESDFAVQCERMFADFLQKVGAKTAVITGVDCGQTIANLVFDGERCHVVANEKVPVTYSGTGDVFSSILTAMILRGESVLKATQIAAKSVENAAKATTCSDRRFGIAFCRVLPNLIEK